MSLPRICLIAFLFLAFGVGAYAQEAPKAVLVDEFGTLCSDDLRARLDLFFATVSEKPESTGYIVGNADRSMPGRLHKYFRIFQSHVHFRRFYSDRVKYFRGPNAELMKFQFWLVPKGVQPGFVPLSFPRELFQNTVMFDASEITLVKKTVVEFGGEWGNEPCDFGLDLNQFAITLGANTGLDGYLIASSNGRGDDGKARLALSLTKAHLIRDHRVPMLRIKTVFAGNRHSRVMQLWLVPKGSQPPAFRENSVP